jgi:hypothetical protein
LNAQGASKAKPLHEFFDNGGALVQAHLFIRNCLSMEWPNDSAARCAEVCHDCWKQAENGLFVTIERSGNRFYVTQAI